MQIPLTNTFTFACHDKIKIQRHFEIMKKQTRLYNHSKRI